MWFKVLKPFAHALEGELMELKENSQYKTLVDAKLIAETEAPVKEVNPVIDNAYSTDAILNQDEKAKAGRPKKEDK